VDWNAYIQQLVAPHVRSIPATDPQQGLLVAGVDAAAAPLMRVVLHAPGFQALEAAWRGVEFLTRRLETDRQLSIHLLDVSQAELTADLTAGDDLSRTGLYHHLVERTVGAPGGEPWAVVLGCYTFGPTRDDAELLGRLAKVVRLGGCAFVAAGHSTLIGCDSFAKHPDPEDWNPQADPDDAAAWAALRQLPEAASVGLALPRLLLRRTYGRRGSPVESFDFEELPDPPVHEGYLWGNPAFAAVALLAQAFSQSGWQLRPGEVSEIEDLPGHVYEADGETHMQPCAEALLTERAGQAILDAGLMPLLSVRGRDAARLAAFRPIGRAAATLAGRWR
jgi:type VI secretion system protein ImpC